VRDAHLDPQEEALIRAFVVPGRREQLLRRVSNPKTRARVLEKLAHFYDLDPRFAHRIPPKDQHLERIYDLLREKGAPSTCHVMGASDLDCRDVALQLALEDVMRNAWGNFISCIPGKLGYFGGEGHNERYILERQADQRCDGE
jgi:hypothetical protein